MKIELPYDAFLRAVKENKDTGHAFLLGAGASISSGVQTATDCIWEWKRNIFVTKNPLLAKQYSSFKSESVQQSIQKWLDTEGTYPAANSQEEYSFYAQAAYPIDDIRRKYFENICKGKEPFVGYKILCELSKKGLVRSVFTTNFDMLVERAAHQTGVTPISVSLATASYIHRASSSTELLCAALHGDFKYGPLKNTGQELDTQHNDFAAGIKKHLYDKHLVVLGYSGRDKSLMEALKEAYSESGGGMLFWCGYGHEIPANVQALLEFAQSKGRQAFYIATEGFDTTLIHIAKTCYEDDNVFQQSIAGFLKGVESDILQKTPFHLDVSELNSLLRSNLLPIKVPTEVFQVAVEFPGNEKVWQTIRNLNINKSVSAVPLKNCLYCFGTQSEIKSTFASIIKGEIKRTPVTYKEIKEGSAFRSLYLSTIVQSIGKTFGLGTNGKNRIWNSDHYTIVKDDKPFHVYDALELSLFFDDKTFVTNPFCYLSINPTFQILSDFEVSKSIRFEIGKTYHENMLRGKPNVKFHEQIQKWISVLFPTGQQLHFEYPAESGTGFKFSISPDTMHVALMKQSTPKYRLTLPSTFTQKKIIHKGIQYNEQGLEFKNKLDGEAAFDFHPMRGLIKNKPYDHNLNGNVFDSEVNLAVICPNTHSTQLLTFLNRLNSSAQAGKNNPDYLLDYPGFHSAYGVPLNIPDNNSEFWKLSEVSGTSESVIQSALNLADQIKRNIDLIEANRKKSVIVIFIPSAWEQITYIDNEHEKFDLHDYIKAYAAQKNIATQFLKEDTLSDQLICQVNWWLSLSFYVKAYRTPWVLQGLQEDTAFVGIGYSVDKRKERNKVVLGCSHIYNSLGQGLKYKLSKVEDCTFDHQSNPFMSYQDAYKFGTMIRELFLSAMGELPKRVVVHKRTYFKPDEINGIKDGLGKSGVTQIDLVEINFEPDAKFISMFSNRNEIKPNNFPLPRGSCFLIDNFTALLWTHGIVPSVRAENNSYFQGGKGMPIPIKIKKHYGTTNINMIATEILGLTKMNWNSFDLYSKLPATIQSSNEIARIGWLLNRFEGKTYDYRNFM